MFFLFLFFLASLNLAVSQMEIGTGHWLWMAACDTLWYVVCTFCKLQVQVTPGFSVCACAWAAVSPRNLLSCGSLRSGEHGLLRIPVSPRIGHAAAEWQGDELRAGATPCSYDTHVDALRVRVVMCVVSHAIGPPDMDLVLLALAGSLAVNRVVEVHALRGVAPPVTPHQIDSSAHQAEHHCGNDRNCMRLTHSGRDMGRGGALTRHNESMAWNERHREEQNRHAGDREGKGGAIERLCVCVWVARLNIGSNLGHTPTNRINRL